MSELTIEDLEWQTYQMDHIIEKQLTRYVCNTCDKENTEVILNIFENEFNLRILNSKDNNSKGKSVTKFIKDNTYTDKYITNMIKLYESFVRPQVLPYMVKEHKEVLDNLDKLLKWKNYDTEDHIIDEQMIIYVCKKFKYNKEKIKEVLKIFDNEFNLRSLNSEDNKSKGESVTKFIKNNNYTDEYIAEMKKLYRCTVRPQVLPYMVKDHKEVLDRLDSLLDWNNSYPNSDRKYKNCKIDNIIEEQIIFHVCKKSKHNVNVAEARNVVWLFNIENNLQILTIAENKNKTLAIANWLKKENLSGEDKEWIELIKKSYKYNIRSKVEDHINHITGDFIEKLDTLMDYIDDDDLTKKIEDLSLE